MSQKRKLADFSGSEDVDATSSKKQRPDFKSKGPWKGPKKSHRAAAPKANSTNALKSRIRDLKRLLGHADDNAKYKMPANVRIERERELEACEHELEEKTRAGQEADFRRKIIGKYHHVRFYDRQKATRALKKIRRQYEAATDKADKVILRNKLHGAEVDLNYTQYYPLLKPYSALFPRTKQDSKVSEQQDMESDADTSPKPQEEDTSEGIRGDPDMWKAVERAMKEGTLDALRNTDPREARTWRKKSEDAAPTKQKKGKKTKPKSLSSGIMRKMVDETKAVGAGDDGESDGGFFE